MRAGLPRGGALPADLWAARHRAVLAILWLHVLAVPAFAVWRQGLAHGLVDVVPLAAVAGLASLPRPISHRGRSALASLGLLSASAVLVHAADGATEAHFHFFVMLALIAMYQDWQPLLVAIAYVGLHHAVFGSLLPTHVYGSGAAATRPLVWAAIHAAAVGAASAANIAAWRITEIQHDRAEEALRASERRFRALIERSADGVSVVRDGLVVYDSPAVARHFGVAERLGRPANEIIHPDDVARVFQAVSAVAPGESTLLTVRVQGADRTRWCEGRFTDLRHDPDIAGIVVNFRDVSERHALEDQLAHESMHDRLTGLPNRALFLERVRTARGAVVLLDLHDFKTVNDALGHVAGDAVLVELGHRLAVTGRAGDTCARLGGDQFGVLLEGVGDEEAWELAHQLLDAVRAGVDVDGERLQLDAAVGVAFARGGETAEEVVRNADLAMGQAKAGGPGGVELFEDGMRHAVLERLGLKVELRRALAAGEFRPHYQPVVSLTSGRTVAAEALVRWHHPRRGILPPAAFIELAEESGLIVDIGRRVLLHACADAVAWPVGPRGGIGVSVNLSPRQLQAEDIVEEVADVLDATGLAPSRLTLEITESVLVADPAAAARTLGALKALGVSIALDDFGTGYSSLSYLSRFPVDVLKIDKSFVDHVDAAEAGTERALLQAIVALGRTLELNVVAEGIERPEQRVALQKLGCGLGQGYLFGRPMPSEELAATLPDVASRV